MFCKYCGTEIADNVKFCPNCGASMVEEVTESVNVETTYAQPTYAQSTYEQPTYEQPTYEQPTYEQANYAQSNSTQPNYDATQKKPGEGFAIAGMICGIVSLVCFGFILGVLGVVFGNVAKSKGYNGGMATAGIVCGVIGFVGAFLVLCLW